MSLLNDINTRATFTPNVTANVRHASLDKCSRDEKKNILIMATLVAEHAKEAMVARMVGLGGVCV
jgi:hypothetical protein